MYIYVKILVYLIILAIVSSFIEGAKWLNDTEKGFLENYDNILKIKVLRNYSAQLINERCIKYFGEEILVGAGILPRLVGPLHVTCGNGHESAEKLVTMIECPRRGHYFLESLTFNHVYTVVKRGRNEHRLIDLVPFLDNPIPEKVILVKGPHPDFTPVAPIDMSANSVSNDEPGLFSSGNVWRKLNITLDQIDEETSSVGASDASPSPASSVGSLRDDVPLFPHF